jgi:homoserine O-acetyltransferase
MDAVVAMTPMARTPAWSVAVDEATRRALLADPTYNNGDYTTQPQGGWRAQTDILTGLDTRTPEGLKERFPNALDVIPWMHSLEDAALKGGFDANDWMWQTWAYDRHDVSTTPGRGFNGDLSRALGSVKAKTVIYSSRLDLYNPVEEAREAAKLIPDAHFVEIPSWGGHQSASAMDPPGVAFLNEQIAAFLGGLQNAPKTAPAGTKRL